MAWTCPDCRRSFGRTNQSHGCAPSGTVDDFFADRPAALRRVYDAIARHLATLDGVTIDPVTVCVMFKRSRTFAEVRAKRQSLVLCFLLSRVIVHDRISKTLRLSAHRTAHFVELAAARDVDRDVRGWLTEAYASSPRQLTGELRLARSHPPLATTLVGLAVHARFELPFDRGSEAWAKSNPAAMP